MKQWITMTAWIALAACASPATDHVADSATDPTAATQKLPIDSTATATSAPIPIDTIAGSTQVDTAAPWDLKGQLLWSIDYCGGAQPSDEMLAEMEALKPLEDQALIVRAGTRNALGTPVVARTKTDHEGRFRIALPPGDYCICLAEKEKKRSYAFMTDEVQAVDDPCDSQWLQTCDILVRRQDKRHDRYKATFEQHCDVQTLSPCVSYHGSPRP